MGDNSQAYMDHNAVLIGYKIGINLTIRRTIVLFYFLFANGLLNIGVHKISWDSGSVMDSWRKFDNALN